MRLGTQLHYRQHRLTALYTRYPGGVVVGSRAELVASPEEAASTRAQGEFKQVLKLLVVLDSCEAAAVWLKWHAAGACSLASHPGASASHPGANTAHRSASIHRRRATVEPQHIAALRCRAHEHVHEQSRVKISA